MPAFSQSPIPAEQASKQTGTKAAKLTCKGQTENYVIEGKDDEGKWRKGKDVTVTREK